MRMAECLVANRSKIFASVASTVAVPSPSMSNPIDALPAWCAAYSLLSNSVEFTPLFSASARGMVSKAAPKRLIAYCSRPGAVSPKAAMRRASSISVAPAPGRYRPSLAIALNTLTPSSTARSTSSMMFSVEPRMTIVAMPLSSPVCSKTVTRVSPISIPYTLSQWPISSFVGAPMRARAVAPVALHRRRSSNFDWIFTTMRLYLLRKWRTMSPTLPPLTTSLTPVSAISLICFSRIVSSPELKFLRSSAFLRRTVPFVSVCATSSGHEYTAILAFSTCDTKPSPSRANTMPRMTRESWMPDPRILATRTLSTLKLATFLGTTLRHASAMRPQRKSSLPYCLLPTAVRRAIFMALISRASLPV
eukprot:Opistho-2@2778